jgi:protein TonB
MILQNRAADNTNLAMRATNFAVTTARPNPRPRRWFPRAGGALLVSAFAHALAAVTVGTVLRATSVEAAHGPSAVEVDVVAPPNAAGETPVSAAPSPAQGSPPRLVPTHVAKLRTAAAPSRARAPVVSLDDTAAPARFVMRAGTVAPQATEAPATTSSAAGASRTSDAFDALNEGDVSVPARLISSGTLVYPPAARQAEVEIDLPLEIVVDTDGRVASARALRRAGYGLDEAALRAIRAYRFSPALRAGLPVRVRMRWTIQFRLG